MNRNRYQDLSKFRVPANFRGRGKIYTQLWWLVQASVFRFSPQFMFGFRRFLLRLFGAQIGMGVLIRPSATITYPWKLSVGNNTWIGDDSVIYNLGAVYIGENVAIAHRVYLCTGLHNTDKITFDIGEKPIKIEEEVWLANDVFVAPGVTVGRGAVIGARSSVFGDMPPGMICIGSPAKPVKPRRSESSQTDPV